MNLMGGNFKVIFYNISPNVQIDPIHSSIKRCSTIEETTSSINEYHQLGHQILVGCRQQDVARLDEPNLNGLIDAIYILAENPVAAQNAGRRITVLSERDLQIHIILDAVNRIARAAGAAEKQQKEDGIVNALRGTVDRLMALLSILNNQV